MLALVLALVLALFLWQNLVHLSHTTPARTAKALFSTLSVDSNKIPLPSHKLYNQQRNILVVLTLTRLHLSPFHQAITMALGQ